MSTFKRALLALVTTAAAFNANALSAGAIALSSNEAATAPTVSEPEPDAAAMVIAGLGLLGFMVRRRLAR
jgi:MYXO-CTERM domain-containing protein